MASVKDLIALMRDPGEAGMPDTIYDDLEFAYDDEIAAAAQERDGASAKIQDLESQISRLKTHNYDLLMESRASAGEGEGSASEGGEPSGDDETDDAESKSIDDLFG